MKIARAIRILEIPVYLLVIAMACTDNSLKFLLIAISIARLVVNIITYDSLYKK
jgi:hypothetical protein